MYYADRLGLARLRDRLTYYATGRGRDSEPAPLLHRLAAEGRGCVVN
jgi:hypothetical protein